MMSACAANICYLQKRGLCQYVNKLNKFIWISKRNQKPTKSFAGRRKLFIGCRRVHYMSPIIEASRCIFTANVAVIMQLGVFNETIAPN